MTFSFISKLFDSNEKEIRKLEPIVLEISALEESIKKIKDSQFSKKTQELKERIAAGESLELILPEAFALVREAARRCINQRHFNVQLMAAIVLSQGKIAEQKTGEGKTLLAVPALYLHALTGKPVHLVTVNDYLARRDAGWMGPIFYFLGISVSAIIQEQSYIFDPTFADKNASDERLMHLRPVSRQEAYRTDVVYGINSEFGFDYLRDNMAQDVSQLAQRGHYFAIVDEVDSVLIDEARTPHIISAPKEDATEKYFEYAQLVEKLSSATDYKIDEKLRTAHLTDHGIIKIEKLFGIKDIYEKDFETVFHLEAALKAKTLFHKERDYIVRDNQVILVDEFTGRLMIGRRLSEGLHQAIEAKEGVPVQKESKTLATVSLQNYFRMYEKLAGMTGTAVTEAEEFHKIYKLDVAVIPTNNSIMRKDLPDAIYKTSRAKFTAVVAEIEKLHKKGQPVLVGTTSIEKNEIISQLLKRKGIKHELLNAKNHEREAEIIAKAGMKGAVTVATNMAGRGVDIVLGGVINDKWDKAHKEVLELGGLYIIGTERHESRRIDNQLRGRSGRQGDPGASQFFVALDDDIMRLFGGESIANLMTRLNMPEDVPLSHSLVSRAIEQAQVKVEGFNFDIRKHLVEYDDVLNKQREIIYARRREILERKDESLHKETIERIRNSLSRSVQMQWDINPDKADETIIAEFLTIIPFDEQSQKQILLQLHQLQSVWEKTSYLTQLAIDLYNQRIKEFGSEVNNNIERFVTLSVIDMYWTDHLDTIEDLRQGIGLRGYGQRDPLVEYKNEAFTLFERLLTAIDDEIVHRIYKVQIQQAPHVHRPIIENTPVSEVSSDKFRSIDVIANPDLIGVKQSRQAKPRKLGRNDPCWCGSGKKYKKCHLNSDQK